MTSQHELGQISEIYSSCGEKKKQQQLRTVAQRINCQQDIWLFFCVTAWNLLSSGNQLQQSMFWKETPCKHSKHMEKCTARSTYDDRDGFVCVCVCVHREAWPCLLSIFTKLSLEVNLNVFATFQENDEAFYNQEHRRLDFCFFLLWKHAYTSPCVPLCEISVWTHLCAHFFLRLFDWSPGSLSAPTPTQQTHASTSYMKGDGGPAKGVLATCGQAECCVNSRGRKGMSRGALSALI